LQLFKKMHFWLRILFNGRKYDSIAGLSNRWSVVLDDNVLCN
jgi:hypothetical protein